MGFLSNSAPGLAPGSAASPPLPVGRDPAEDVDGPKLDAPRLAAQMAALFASLRQIGDCHQMSLVLDTRVMKGDRAAIAAAARCLAAGGLVAFPTETVYGLGADATDGAAIARLYAAKGRPAFNPLIAHVADATAARHLAVFDPAAERLATLWPGPLTLVLPKSAGNGVADLAVAGLDTIALRVPEHRIAHDLIVALGKPIVAPSANPSAHLPPTPPP